MLTVGKDLAVAAPEVETVLEQARQIDGFVLACLVEATSGMVLAAVEERDGMSVPVAAAGAADVVNVLAMMNAALATKGDLEDVIVTLDSHYHLIRVLQPEPEHRLLLLVTLDRPGASLAMAHREVRELSMSLRLWAAGGRLTAAAPRGSPAGQERPHR